MKYSKMYKLLYISIIICIIIRNNEATTSREADMVKDELQDIENDLTFSSIKSGMKIEYKRSLKQENVNADIVDDDGQNKEIIDNYNSTEECVGNKEYCNMTKEEYLKMMNDFISPDKYTWLLIFTHAAVFVIGLIGNTLVCVAVYKNHTMRTVTNYFLVNLAVADFMVLLFCLPATVLADVTKTWFLGDSMCRILLFFQSTSVMVSVLTLTFISVDRWYAFCFPLKFKSNINRAKTAIFVIWAVSILFNTPELIIHTTVMHEPLRFDLKYLVQCVATWSDEYDFWWHIIKGIFMYSLPLLLMTVAYHQIVKVLWSSERLPGQAETITLASAEQSQLRSRRKAAKMLVAVVIMFAICFFPVHLLLIIRTKLNHIQHTEVITCLALVSHVLCYVNSAVNPLIYNFMSDKYRREFRRAFKCSSRLTNNSSSIMTRFTTSKKKITQNYEKDQKCNHMSLKTYNCNHMALKSQNNCDDKCERLY